MTPEQLMQPRYKVIADYPGNKLEVRSILDQGIRDCFNCDGIIYHESILKKYPHIFKPLQWWEERKLKEMPEYVKCLKSPDKIIEPGSVLKVAWNDHGGKADNGPWIFPYTNCYEPATEAEYTTYINSKKWAR